MNDKAGALSYGSILIGDGEEIGLSQTQHPLEGEWALILGCSSGFGGATAKELARQGMNIFGVHLDRKATMANALSIQREIESLGRRAFFSNVDASNPQNMEEIAQTIQTTFAAASEPDIVRVVVHSLAFGSLRPYFTTDPDDAPPTQRQMESTLHVMGHSLVYWVQTLFHKGLLGAGSRIYALTSSGTTRAMPSYGAVSAAKAVLESHTRQIALELSHLGITANCIRAGVTDTPALRKIPGNEAMLEKALAHNPSGRLTVPEDVAKAIALLSHPNNQWMTGNVIGVDGGELVSA